MLSGTDAQLSRWSMESEHFTVLTNYFLYGGRPMPSLLKTSSLLVLGLAIGGCSQSRTKRLNLPPLTAVPSVDLQRYAGTWYEIASYPNRFQEGCTGTTATYSLNADGTIKVLNQCRKDTLDGPEMVAEGRARTPNPTRPAELEVSFFGPFWGDYWVIQLDPDYRYAVVGQPDRDYLWILSRTPTMPAEQYTQILSSLSDQSYPIEPLRRTLQGPSTQ